MSFDRRALLAGISVAFTFGVPFMLLAAYLSRGDRTSDLAPWLILLGIGGFIVGSGVAAMSQTVGLPVAHGTITALASYLGPQIVLITVQLAQGDAVRWLAALFNLSTVSVAGVIGGSLGAMMQRRGLKLGSLGPPGSTANAADDDPERQQP